MAHHAEGTPPASRCPICAELDDEEYAAQKYGWEEHDTYLPAAAAQLHLVYDLQPYSSRKLQIKQCPICGGYYLYRSDYEYLVNGSEDEEQLSRLSPEQAAAYLAEKTDPANPTG